MTGLGLGQFFQPVVPPRLSATAEDADMMAKKYETVLSPEEEKAFQRWKKRFAPEDSGYDYDLRGAFKAGLAPDPKTAHWPDTFKKPNHPTFSVESIYAKERPDLAGSWGGPDGQTYIPPKVKK